ncbi:TFIIB-type zinc ribbon-containing protein [Paenibacillus sp.]|jgi:hypothetical protein|uniref:TFIIB-type zinc ribbon-containing protein n=1 Tax=Paenibacillus sp. TaxID=58172 RepID=UPI0028252BD1|nr:TFIIB-type zinc ribbon-containing protein [Paenibacillus sp.]MDR0269989.1 TFIIB-type zinc ribbon-containing protein [Paenibacillus sp.]
MNFEFKSKYKIFDRIILGITFTFFPLGWLMVLIRVLSTHVHHSCKGRNHRLLGWCLVYTYLILMAFVYLSYDDFGPAESSEFGEYVFYFGLAMILPALAFFVLGGAADRKFNSLLSQYYHLVMERGINEIDHIAYETGQSPYPVIRDLDFMINERMLPFGRIENSILELEPEGYHQQYETNVDYEEYEDDVGDDEYDEDEYDEDEYDDEDSDDEEEDTHTKSKGPRMMECPGCGARIFVVPNERKECEYCGNVISM